MGLDEAESGSWRVAWCHWQAVVGREIVFGDTGMSDDVVRALSYDDFSS